MFDFDVLSTFDEDARGASVDAMALLPRAETVFCARCDADVDPADAGCVCGHRFSYPPPAASVNPRSADASNHHAHAF